MALYKLASGSIHTKGRNLSLKISINRNMYDIKQAGIRLYTHKGPQLVLEDIYK